MQLDDIRKTVDYARRNGISAAIAASRERLRDNRTEYVYEPPSEEELSSQRTKARQEMEAGQAPLISVVVPKWKTPEELLDAMKASVEAQSYENYELVITEEPGGISANTNAALEKARGSYIALLDHDDLLTPDALYHMAAALREAKDSGIDPVLIYSDEDKLAEDGSFYAPNIKPDFNYDYLLSNNYICHFTMIEASHIKKLGLRSEFDGAQDHDLFLRLVKMVMDEENGRAAAADARFLHVPRVLYHWRATSESTSKSGGNKTYAHEAGRRAVEAHLRDSGAGCAVENLPHRGFFRADYGSGIFGMRPDIGAVGGKLVNRKGSIVGGMIGKNGEVMFDGLPKGFSGGWGHRAVCQQDAFAVDIADITVRPELVKELPEDLRAAAAVPEGRPREADRAERIALSLKLCGEIRKLGYRIMWDPMRETVIE